MKNVEIMFNEMVKNPRTFVTFEDYKVTVEDIVKGVIFELLMISALALLFALSFTSFWYILHK